MWISSSLIDKVISTTSFPNKNFFVLIVWFLFWKIGDLNLSRLTIISENHLMAFSDSAISISNSNLTDLEYNRVLSSAKLWADAFLMNKKKSFKYALSKVWPTI